MKKFCLLFFTFVLSISSFAQDGRIAEAEKILNSAREAAYKGIAPEDVKGFILTKDILVSVAKMPTISLKKTVLIDFPDRIQLISKTLLPSIPDHLPSYMKSVMTANGEKVRISSFVSFDGGKEELVNERDAMRRAGFSKKDIEKKLKETRDKETKEAVKNSAWADVFPVFLQAPWEKERKFSYLGKAKVNGKAKHVLRLAEGINASASLFFDEQTRLLTHVQAEKGEQKVKYFFSDYQEMDGLLVAKKINTEAIVTMKDGTKQRTIQKITVTDFKLNPVFKEGTFEVKK